MMIAACVFILRAIGGFSHVLRDCRSVAQGISFSNAGIEVQLATQEANMSIFLAAVRFAELPLAVSKPLAGACLLLAVLSTSAGAADAPRSREALTVDAFSVVRIHTKAVPDARSNRTLGPEREGTGIVIDSSGLILTIGYLIQEAESVEIATSDGRSLPASVIAYDFPTGFGLLRAVRAPPIRPIALGDSSKLGDTEPVLIVGFDGVAPAFVVSRRPFTGYWEYLLD